MLCDRICLEARVPENSGSVTAKLSALRLFLRAAALAAHVMRWDGEEDNANCTPDGQRSTLLPLEHWCCVSGSLTLHGFSDLFTIKIDVSRSENGHG